MTSKPPCWDGRALIDGVGAGERWSWVAPVGYHGRESVMAGGRRDTGEWEGHALSPAQQTQEMHGGVIARSAIATMSYRGDELSYR